ncbi:peptidase [Rhodospirillum rubrum]|uniref:peptidase n=1 Tax=Rhodospirillum rubrum TaxID=1085 RepID=UPI0019074C6F|nr:peptidase [Rhodospirillum rubrum]MBK1663832.1 peptidase [Rhodospirillum rubrum]MBK1678260.1 peptidase [Rhodospirillum rubrum]
MTRRMMLLLPLTAGLLATPALAFAFGPGGDGCGAGGLDRMGGPMGGRGAPIAQMREAANAATLGLAEAVQKARSTAPGTVTLARLSPFAVAAPGAAPGANRPNSFADPALKPTYLVSVIEDDTRRIVAVDAATGQAAVVGSASGILAYRGGFSGHPGMGGPRRARTPVDLSGAKVTADQAITTAVEKMGSGKAMMVKGIRRGDDSAWVVAVAPSAADGAATMVFIDPDSGSVLSTRQMPNKMGWPGNPGSITPADGADSQPDADDDTPDASPR